MNSTLYTKMISLGIVMTNSVRQVLTRYASDIAGLIDKKSEFYAGKAKDAAASAALSEGMFVVWAGEEAAAATDTDGAIPLFEKCGAGLQPDGYLEKKSGDYLLIRKIKDDVELTGIVAGSDYFVGTDSRPAKAGDSTFPSAVSSPVCVGIGWVTGVLMFGAAPRANSAPLAKKITTASSEFTGNTRTNFDQALTLDLTKLKVGDQLEISGLIDIGAPNTVTSNLYLSIGSLDIFSSAPLDPVNAGDTLCFHALVEVKSIGSSGTITACGSAGLTGDVTGKNYSGGGLATPTTLDLTQTAAPVRAAMSFSSAGANSATLTQFSVAPVYRPQAATP